MKILYENIYLSKCQETGSKDQRTEKIKDTALTEMLCNFVNLIASSKIVKMFLT